MSNYPPGFDFDVDSGVHDDCVTVDNAAKCFIGGLQAMREMLARFVEQGGTEQEKNIAMSLRANWHPSWGPDPGKPDVIVNNWDQCF